jgi:hypothetical protein
MVSQVSSIQHKKHNIDFHGLPALSTTIPTQLLDYYTTDSLAQVVHEPALYLVDDAT